MTGSWVPWPKHYLEHQLAAINEALAKAQEQPATMSLLDSIAKAQVKDNY
jgi:hypothetical protein